MIKVEKGNFPYRYVVNGKDVIFDEATIGRYKGKTFIIYDGMCTEVIDMKYKMGGVSHPVRIPLEVELADKELPYKEVFLKVARQSKFTIDGWEKIFKGYTFNQYWNGWEMPLFEKEEAMEIIKKVSDGDYWDCEYNEEKDVFTIKDLSLPPEENLMEIESRDIETEDGRTVHVYDFGSLGWIWDEEDTEDNVDGIEE